MTNKEILAIAGAINRVAKAPKADHLTIRAITRSLAQMLDQTGHEKRPAMRGFNFMATDTVDLSGRNWLAEIGVDQ